MAAAPPPAATDAAGSAAAGVSGGSDAADVPPSEKAGANGPPTLQSKFSHLALMLQCQVPLCTLVHFLSAPPVTLHGNCMEVMLPAKFKTSPIHMFILISCGASPLKQ